MASTINASTTSTTGLVYSADGTGILQLQSDGTTGLTVGTGGNVTVNTNLFVSGSEVKPLVLGNVQSTTSGTAINFTGIPNWVKRVTVMFDSVSSNGTSNFLIQFGTSSGFVTTGYNSGSAYILSNSSYLNTQYTAGFGIAQASSPNSISGALTFTLLTSNTWVLSGVLNTTQNATWMNAGIIALASALTQLRLTTVNGTDTFDAGSVNIMYE